jgi:hypothetical protein
MDTNSPAFTSKLMSLRTWMETGSVKNFWMFLADNTLLGSFPGERKLELIVLFIGFFIDL